MGRDPEFKSFSNPDSNEPKKGIYKFPLATTKGYLDSEGALQQSTTWHQIVTNSDSYGERIKSGYVNIVFHLQKKIQDPCRRRNQVLENGNFPRFQHLCPKDCHHQEQDC